MRKPPEQLRPVPELVLVDTVPHLRIGAIAERLGLSHRSIRYYEEAGVVIPVKRTAGGFRLYSELDVQRFLIVMSMQPLDFSLEEIGRFLTAVDDLRGTSESATRRAALTVLDEFAEATDQKWAQLRTRVEIARGFRTYLNHGLSQAGDGANTGRT